MEISPIRIFYMLLWSLAFGAVCGAVNDINRLFRIAQGATYVGAGFERLRNIRLPVIGEWKKNKKTGKLKKTLFFISLFFQDIFLFLFAGVGTAIINYYFNDGKLRIYAPIAVILGFILYYFTLGRAVIYFSEVILFSLRLIFAVLLVIFYLPLRGFVDFLVKIGKKILKNLNKAIAKRQKKVYNKRRKEIVAANARHGFVDLSKR